MNQPKHRAKHAPIGKIKSAAVRGRKQLKRSKTAHFTGDQFWA